MSARFFRGVGAAFGAVAVVALLAAMAGAASAREQADIYTVHALVSDGAAVSASATDASLVNGWGLTRPARRRRGGRRTTARTPRRSTTAPARSRRSTVAVAGAPTGTVFNGNAADFVVSQNGKSGAARFLFATEGGTILGWSPTVNRHDRDRRRRPLDAPGAIYKGLATRRRHACTRPTSTTGASTCSTQRSSSSPASLHRPEDRRRASRRSASRRSAATSSSPTRSRTRAKKDDVAGAGPGLRRRVHARRAARSDRS